jgi:hypothetical protein
MTEEEPMTCSRCGRDAPRQLDGIADDPHWAAWEVTADGEDLLCPGCLTRPELLSTIEGMGDEEIIPVSDEVLREIETREGGESGG